MIGQPHTSPSIPPKILWPVLIVVILGIAVGGFFLLNSYIYNEKKGDNVNTAVVAEQENTSSTNSTENTKPDDWNTYINPDHGYSVQYPKDWDAAVSENDQNQVNLAPTGKEYGPFESPFVSISFKDELYPDDPCLMRDETVEVAGVSYHQQEEGCSYAGSTVATFFPVDQGDMQYLVISWTTDVPEYFDTYNKILSTFEFTTPTNDELFLALRGDNAINIYFYDPIRGSVIRKYEIPIAETLAEFNTHGAWGNNYIVQYDASNHNVLFDTNGSSLYDGSCINPDGTCDNRLYYFNLGEQKKEIITTLDFATGNWAIDPTSNNILMSMGLGHTRRIQMINPNTGEVSTIFSRDLEDDLNSSYANIIYGSNNRLLQARSESTVGASHHTTLYLDKIDISSGNVETTEVAQHTSIEYETDASLDGNYITYTADRKYVLKDISKDTETVIYDGGIKNHTKSMSPNGDKIAFIGDGLQYYDRSTGQSQQIEKASSIFPLRWSDSARYLAFAEPPAIYVFDTKTGESKKINIELGDKFSVNDIVGAQWVTP